jgi:hypothetical protein
VVVIHDYSESELEFDATKLAIHNQFIQFRQIYVLISLCQIRFEGVQLSLQEFNRLLLEAVDEGLSTLGESSKQAIYFHLEKRFAIKKQEIPEKIKLFAYAIEKIFGLGANFLEILIMRRLYEKLGRSFKFYGGEDFTFTEYVAAARQSFEEREKSKKAAVGLFSHEEVAME